MPKIYDNIENQLTKGLNETLNVSNRADFCVGYFNLRGWNEVANQIEELPGAEVFEGQDDIHRISRLLVGMQKMPAEILQEHFNYDEDRLIDLTESLKLKKKLAQEFKQQLTIETPTEADEVALRKLSRQLKEQKVVVKLHLRYTLHAKLYLYNGFVPRHLNRLKAQTSFRFQTANSFKIKKPDFPKFPVLPFPVQIIPLIC